MNYIRKIKLRQLDLNTLRTILLPNLCIQGGKSGMEALMEQYKIDIVVEENKNSTNTTTTICNDFVGITFCYYPVLTWAILIISGITLLINSCKI